MYVFLVILVSSAIFLIHKNLQTRNEPNSPLRNRLFRYFASKKYISKLQELARFYSSNTTSKKLLFLKKRRKKGDKRGFRQQKEKLSIKPRNYRKVEKNIL